MIDIRFHTFAWNPFSFFILRINPFLIQSKYDVNNEYFLCFWAERKWENLEQWSMFISISIGWVTAFNFVSFKNLFFITRKYRLKKYLVPKRRERQMSHNWTMNKPYNIIYNIVGHHLASRIKSFSLRHSIIFLRLFYKYVHGNFFTSFTHWYTDFMNSTILPLKLLIVTVHSILLFSSLSHFSPVDTLFRLLIFLSITIFRNLNATLIVSFCLLGYSPFFVHWCHWLVSVSFILNNY